MTTAAVVLVAATFLASAVEGVEALTIVLAVGVTRGWRSALIGAGVAGLVLAALVAALGPALTAIPLSALRVVVGALLLIFGLQWLRKAILRAAGYKALHDEDAIYHRKVDEARQAGRAILAGMDWYSFTIAFKGVLLEGLEVVFIVLTFGSSQGSVPLAATGAVAAVALVILAGVLIHAPLSQVPENTLKFAVGVMLITYGIFWGGEGVGVAWPGGDAAILALLPGVMVLAVALVSALRWQRARALVSQTSA